MGHECGVCNAVGTVSDLRHELTRGHRNQFVDLSRVRENRSVAEAISTGSFRPRSRAETELSCAVPVTSGRREVSPASADMQIDVHSAGGGQLRCGQSSHSGHIEEPRQFSFAL